MIFPWGIRGIIFRLLIPLEVYNNNPPLTPNNVTGEEAQQLLGKSYTIERLVELGGRYGKVHEAETSEIPEMICEMICTALG